MSHGQDSGETVEVVEDDITVQKSFAPEEFPVPAIKFVVRSNRDTAVEIRLVDGIPESFPMERIGFHPEYDSDKWTAYQDHHVEYERELEPGEEIVTVYGIRSDDPEVGAQFMTEPEIQLPGEGDESDDVEDVIGGDHGDPVRDVLAGEEESLPGDDEGDAEAAEDVVTEAEPEDEGEDEAEALEAESDGAEADEAAEESDADEAAAEDGEADEEIELDEPAPEPRAMSAGTSPAITRRETADEAEADEEEASDEADEEEEAETPGVGVAEGAVAAALAEELRAGNVAEEDIETLSAQLDWQTPRSVDVRIGRLQTKVEDLWAYSDALKEFLDENGTAEEVVEGFREDLSDTQEELAALSDELDATEARHEELQSAVGDHGDRLDAAAEERAEVAAEVDAVSEDVDAVESAVSDVEDDVSDINTELSEAFSEIADVESDVASLQGELNTVAGDVDDVASEVDDVDTRVDDVEGKVDDVDATVETVESNLADLEDQVAGLSDDVEHVEANVETDLSDVEADIEDLKKQLNDMRRFRERIMAAFTPEEQDEIEG